MTSTTLLLLLTTFITTATCLPSVTPTQLTPGTCQSFPNSFSGAGDNADAFTFSPDQVDDASLNGLTTSILSQTLVVYPNSSSNAPVPTIFCCDRGGTVLDGFGVQPLLLTTSNLNDEQLSYTDIGIKPQTYAHEVNGTRLDGVFLGWGNVTTWGFRKVPGKSYWAVRLLVPTGRKTRRGEEIFPPKLYDGEVKGFLKVEGWVVKL